MDPKRLGQRVAGSMPSRKMGVGHLESWMQVTTDKLSQASPILFPCCCSSHAATFTRGCSVAWIAWWVRSCKPFRHPHGEQLL